MYAYVLRLVALPVAHHVCVFQAVLGTGGGPGCIMPGIMWYILLYVYVV